MSIATKRLKKQAIIITELPLKRELDLSEIELKVIPPEIGKLTALETLTIDRSDLLSSVPKSFGNTLQIEIVFVPTPRLVALET